MVERAGGKAKTSTAKKTTAAKASTATAVAVEKTGAAKKTAAVKETGTKAKAKKASSSVNNPPVQASPSAAPSAAKGATMVKPAEQSGTSAKTVSRATTKPAQKQGSRSAAETEKIRVALDMRLAELRAEYEHTLAEITELQRDRLTDSAGDDQADTGTKTFEREQEITLANTMLERVTQVERALERLDEGSYGWCERCGNPIPVERLAAFPSATLCVSCKQLEERR